MKQKYKILLASKLTLFIDDLAARVPDDMLRLSLSVYRPLQDDGGSVHFGPVGRVGKNESVDSDFLSQLSSRSTRLDPQISIKF